MLLSGARVLLTGAGGGIGAAIARDLAGDGATIVLSGRDAKRLDAVRARLPGSQHVVAPVDLERTTAAQELLEASGAVDVFVAAAGVPASGWLSEYRPEQLARALRVNLHAPIEIALLALPAMLQRRRGHLLFVSSLAAKAPSPGASIYCATKFGLRGFALALRNELRGSGVGVSVVSPGFVSDAGMFAESGAEQPPGVGSFTAEQVAARVGEAIAGDRAEVVAAPRRHRAIAHSMLCAPRLWARALSGRDAVRTAREISAGQVDRR